MIAGGMSTERVTANGPGAINLSKKFSGNRKRNARDKSYDLYNQKLQLPPMMKPHETGAPGQGGQPGNITHRGNGKNERTYSLPSAGQVHQSMPMSPNMAINNLNNQSKGSQNQVAQRQSINEALKVQT